MPSTTTAVRFRCSLRSSSLPLDAFLWALMVSAAWSTSSCHGLPPPKSSTEALYRSRCGNCHELPSSKDYSSNDWNRIMSQMSRSAGLSGAQETELRDWLRRQSEENVQ